MLRDPAYHPAMDENGWLIELSDRVVPRSWEEPFAELSEPERVFVAIWTLEADVNNGGFDQYFVNSCSSAMCRSTRRASGARSERARWDARSP